MDIEELKSILMDGTSEEKINILNYLCDVFESYNKDINNFDEILEFLVSYAVNSIMKDIKDEALEAICKAGVYQNITNVNFDLFEENLNNTPIEFLDRYIDILSYTHNKKYLHSILKFKNYDDKYIRKSVNDAITELGVIE